MGLHAPIVNHNRFPWLELTMNRGPTNLDEIHEARQIRRPQKTDENSTMERTITTKMPSHSKAIVDHSREPLLSVTIGGNIPPYT